MPFSLWVLFASSLAAEIPRSAAAICFEDAHAVGKCVFVVQARQPLLWPAIQGSALNELSQPAIMLLMIPWPSALWSRFQIGACASFVVTFWMAMMPQPFSLTLSWPVAMSLSQLSTAFHPEVGIFY